MISTLLFLLLPIPRRVKVISVDFDGTLCKNKWPGIGKPHRWLMWKLKQFQRRGGKLILNTCRQGPQLHEALDLCGCAALWFDAVNANLPERIKQYGGDCRKISADLYLDDKAIRVRA